MAPKRTSLVESEDGWLHVISSKFLRTLKAELEVMGEVKVYYDQNPYQPEPERQYSGVPDLRFYLYPKVPIIQEVEASETYPYYLLPRRNTRRDDKKWTRATSIGNAAIVYGTYGDFGLEY